MEAGMVHFSPWAYLNQTFSKASLAEPVFQGIISTARIVEAHQALLTIAPLFGQDLC